MRQYRDIPKLEPVQKRIAQIRQAQEQVRLAQGKGRQKLETLETLGNWKQIAINLERSDGYGQRIQEITDDYRRSKPLKENQIKAINYDFSAYREQRREAQVQRQRQQEFSL
ncbi:MAG: hypothetical protein MH252_21210 [Thermosynechococcaceae cyanobacterium MS004]|nr:hypothetical protein [Thermosynechococcaceae cyanobacterium MS004]